MSDALIPLAPAALPTLGEPSPGPRNPLAAAMAQIPEPVRRRALPAAMLAGTLAASALIWSIVAAEPQRTLLPALAEEDKALVAAALDGGGIAYNLDGATGAIEVGEGDYHRARMLLAAEGLPKAPAAAETLIDAMPMGSSRAVEGERLRLAREADLARTIEAMDAVEQARVHLAVEQRSAFVRDRAAPAASVMVRLARGRSLSEAQIDAVVHLVASSVPGMDAAQVSLIDQAGRLLSGPGRGGDSAADRQLQLQMETEDRLRQSVEALLTPIVGAENFSAQVNVQLDFAERQATRETYPQDQSRLAREEGRRETGDGSGRAAMGIPGALSNRVPPDPAVTATPPGVAPPAAAMGGASGPSSETWNRQFQLGREVAVERAAVGTVRRLSVAVALANPRGGRARSQAEIAAIEALVRSTVGFDAARGDVVTVNARPFSAGADAAAAPAWWEAPWLMPLARGGAALIAILALFWFVIRPLRRAAAARAEGASTTLPSGEGPIANAALPSAELQRIAAAPGWAERAELVRAFVAQHPERSTQLIHDLLRQPEPANG